MQGVLDLSADWTGRQQCRAFWRYRAEDDDPEFDAAGPVDEAPAPRPPAVPVSYTEPGAMERHAGFHDLGAADFHG